MKRFFSIFAVAALLCQAAVVFAQDTDEPSIQSVLDAARAKYFQDSGSDALAEAESEAESDDEVASGDEAPANAGPRDNVPYTPILISFVPGISFPFGYYDAAIAAGWIANMSRDINGAEGAGVFNLSRDVRGFQGAGVFNIVRSVFGFQGAGVFNIVDQDFTGFQGAGVFNIVDGRFTGFQGAGVFNIGDEMVAPIQGAGVFNIALELDGFQAAGLFNIAGRVKGGQAASLFNSAQRIVGIQIGVVNVADHIDGVQLGLLNFAGNGVNSASVTYEPATDFFYAHWQAGTPALFTVVGLGAPSGDWMRDLSGFVASYGLGSRTRAFGLNIDLDVSATQPIGKLPFETLSGSDDLCAWEGWSMMRPYPSVRLTAGLPLGRRLQIVGGLKVDIDAASLGDRVPEALKTGDDWKGSLFGEDFTAYYKWFFGVKL
jgi:hypothetical protein